MSRERSNNRIAMKRKMPASFHEKNITIDFCSKHFVAWNNNGRLDPRCDTFQCATNQDSFEIIITKQIQ